MRLGRSVRLSALFGFGKVEVCDPLIVEVCDPLIVDFSI